MSQTIQLDGRSLSIEDVVAVARRSAAVTIARHAVAAVRRSRRTAEAPVARAGAMYGGAGAAVTIARHALDAVRRSRRTVEDAVARGVAMYGVTTGFGKLAHVRIPPERARQLQLNLIRSHASGVGDPLSVEAVRAMMLLRANVLVRGTSGVRPELPELIVAMLNHRGPRRVPSQASVGASGDLPPP